MIIRPYTQGDEIEVHQILCQNGVAEERQLHDAYTTWVMETETILGFFTYTLEANGFPLLLHFNLRPECKKTNYARVLIKAFRQVIREGGFRKAIVHANTGRMKRITEYYFRQKPYAEVGLDAYYLVEV